MGLTGQSSGLEVLSGEFKVKKSSSEDKVVAVAGNPNVGKSTVFNQLTGLNQHTGNWPGKTVTNAQGTYSYKDEKFILVDLPGTYSLLASSLEEEIARDFICFGKPDMVLVILDATSLERNLNLVLQILEITQDVVVCVNLLDEAKKKNIEIDLDELSLQLGVPVVGTSARSKEGLEELKEEVYNVSLKKKKTFKIKIEYDQEIEHCIEILESSVENLTQNKIDSRWVSLKILDTDEKLIDSISAYIGLDMLSDKGLNSAIESLAGFLIDKEINKENIRDKIVYSLVSKAQNIYSKSVHVYNENYNERDRKIDKILTSKKTGIPVMIILLFVIFWLTISGANYPSDLIAEGLFFIQDRLTELFINMNAPSWLYGSVVLGVYRTVAWVVSVMLPPMAIFFPMFTLLEDSGYLPRIAFNLDNFFKKANAHGKQSLTMW